MDTITWTIGPMKISSTDTKMPTCQIVIEGPVHLVDKIVEKLKEIK